MASEEHPFDLGDSCECITCHKRYCTCPNRNPDGSIREMPKPPVKEFCRSVEPHPDYAVTPTMNRIGHIPVRDADGYDWFLYQCPGCKVVEWIHEDGRPKEHPVDPTMF